MNWLEWIVLSFSLMVIAMMIWSQHMREVKRKEREIVRERLRNLTQSSQAWLDENRDWLD